MELFAEQSRQPRIADGTTNTWQAWAIASWPLVFGAALVMLYLTRLTGGPSWWMLALSLLACVVLADSDWRRDWDPRLQELLSVPWWAIVPPLYLWVRCARFHRLDQRAMRPFWLSMLLLVVTLWMIERGLPIVLRLQAPR